MAKKRKKPATGTIPGVRPGRFGWQEEESFAFLDENGNRREETREEFLERIKAKSKKAKKS
jgi:hypothetical protein